MIRRAAFVLLAAVAGCADAGDDLGLAADAAAVHPAADAAAPDAPPACVLVPNGGCPAGAACDVPPGGGTPACRAAGTGLETRTCTPTDCAAGYTCLSAHGLGASCVRLCASDPGCSGPGSLCVLEVGAGVTACSQACDPLGQAGCPPSWACQLEPEAFPGTRTLTRCTAAGTGGQGATCAREEDCQPGFGCSPGNVCLRRCVLGQSGCAAYPGTACTALSTHPTIGGVEYGVCHS